MTTNGAAATELPVLIIGSGCCGLAIANGLTRAGVTCRVIEKNTALTRENERDWGIACHWSAPILAELMGPEKWSRIQSVQCDPNFKTPDVDAPNVYNGATGEVVNQLHFPKVYRFLRSRLRALLAEDIDVCFGKRLVSLTYHRHDKQDDGPLESSQSSPPLSASYVTAHYEDGTSEQARLVIGADGSNSTVRQQLFADINEPELAKLKQLPLNAIFVNASYTREQALFLRSFHPITSVVAHPDDMFSVVMLLDAPSQDRPEDWRFTFYISWRLPVEEQEAEAAVLSVRERLAQARERSQVFADPIRSCFAWLDDDHDKVYWTRNMNWDPSLPEHAWDNQGGLVTLAGDAAHAMTYHRGQGLNHALDDAGKLVKLLTGSSGRSQNEVIDVYETEMRARAGEEVRLSEMNSYMLHDWAQVRQSPLMTRQLAKGTRDEPPAVRNGTSDPNKSS